MERTLSGHLSYIIHSGVVAALKLCSNMEINGVSGVGKDRLRLKTDVCFFYVNVEYIEIL